MRLLVVFFVFSLNCFSQPLLQKNEECLYSFTTKNGKTIMLAKEKSNGYIVYRYGKDNKIELEFPEKNAQSWKRFTFNYYFRGGGKQNAGLDINNVKFENNGYKYTIYSSYSAGDANNEESYTVGILIYDKNEKLTRIEGIPATEVGSLGVFRTNELLTIDLESGLEE